MPQVGLYAVSGGGLPEAGAVLGLDVGFSVVRRSSAVCRLAWDAGRVCWTVRRFRAVAAERAEAIAAVAGGKALLAAAFDGPLAPGLPVIGRYRTAERMLTRRLGRHIGKPGQAHVPVGRALNVAANACAQAVLAGCRVGPARHAPSIDERAIVETFPSSFLGVMLERPAELAARRSDRSDVFYRHLAGAGTLRALLASLLPGRRPASGFEDVTDHDERAALVCALGALGVASGAFTAVGDAMGWIVLPPRRFVQPWAWAELEANAREEALLL